MDRVVIDTNVVLDNPEVLLSDDIQIVLPYVVLQELDKLKRNPDLNMAARMGIKAVKEGLKSGKIEIVGLPTDNQTNDEIIVETAKEQKAKLWTSDVGASVIGLHRGVEEYITTTSDYDPNYKGYSYHMVESDAFYSVFNMHDTLMASEVELIIKEEMPQNHYIFVYPDDKSNNHRIFWKHDEGYELVVEGNKLYRGISQKGSRGLDFQFLHEEQAMAFHAVWNTQTPLAVIQGGLGVGKSVIATVAALSRVAGNKTHRKYNKILVTRPNRPISKDYDIGFLPGVESEKLHPWLSGFTSNLEFLFEKTLEDVENQVAQSVFNEYFKPVSIASVQGASFHNSLLLIDEGQLLDVNALKQLLSRIADTSKVVVILDPAQTYGANRGREGFKKLLPICRDNPLISYINLQHTQRSPLTSLVKDML